MGRRAQKDVEEREIVLGNGEKLLAERRAGVARTEKSNYAETEKLAHLLKGASKQKERFQSLVKRLHARYVQVVTSSDRDGAKIRRLKVALAKILEKAKKQGNFIEQATAKAVLHATTKINRLVQHQKHQDEEIMKEKQVILKLI